MPLDTVAQPSPSALASNLIYAGYAFQVVVCLVELGVADALHVAPAAPADVAGRLDLDPDALRRLLRAAATLGLVEPEGDRYALTAVGRRLAADAEGSLAPLARMFGSEHYQTTTRALPEVVRTGRTAAQLLFGVDSIFEIYARDPAVAALFNAGMTANSASVGPAVAAAYEVSQAGLIVDVGGGEGRLLGSILAAHPAPKGLVFDTPKVAEKARIHIEGLGLSSRLAAAGGDMFDAVPEGGDLYLLSAVLHDWSDADSVRVLAACRRAMGPDARLLVIERVMADAPQVTPTAQNHALSDLNMLVRTGGVERTEGEFRALLAAGGFELLRVIPTGSSRSIVEARAA